MDESHLRASIRESRRAGAASIVKRAETPPPGVLTALAVRARAGDERAADQVIDGISALVHKYAEAQMRSWLTHLPAHASFDDAFAAGLEGVQRAILGFDEKKGFEFTTYAGWWIRNAIQKALYDLVGSGAIRVKRIEGGIDAADVLVGGNVLSVEYAIEHENDPTSPSTVEGELFDLEAVRALVTRLGSIHHQLPEIVELVGEDVSYRRISKIVGIPERRVRDLHEQAKALVAVELA